MFQDYLDNLPVFSPRFALIIYQICSDFGANLVLSDNTGTKQSSPERPVPGPEIYQKWLIPGPEIYQKWPIPGPEMYQKWPIPGPEIHQKWPIPGPDSANPHLRIFMSTLVILD